MNWKILILAFVAVQFVYDMILNVIKTKAINNPIPENVADLYDADTYLRWKAYKKEHGRLHIIFTVIYFATNMLLLALNVHALFARLFPEGFFWQLFAVVLLETVVSIPLHAVQEYIATMVIEEKYGFNRTTMKTFIIDQIRSVLLNLAIMTALLTILALLYRSLGDWVILVFAGVLFVVILGIVFLHPIFSRMQNKFVPLEDGSLKERLQELLHKYGYQVRAIEVMDGSKRTTKANAYFTGFGKMKTIVLYDNILNLLTEDEICAVFAHEMGHGLHKDTLKSQLLNIFNLVIMSAVIWLAIKLGDIHTAFGFAEVNYGFAYVIMTIALVVVDPLINVVQFAHSRHAEYKADRVAVKEGYGKELITALKKLNSDAFGHPAPAKTQVILEYSHPPMSERIAAIEAAAKTEK